MSLRRFPRRLQRQQASDATADKLLNQNQATLPPGAGVDYPLKAIEPKVLIPFENPPGKIPRRIEIERKRRFFQAQDINELLKEKGIDYSDPSCTLVQSHLPLAVFDDTEYDCRTPLEWISLGMDGNIFKYVPAKALHFDSSTDTGVWKNCRVVEYEHDRDEYIIEWEDNKQREYIPRISLMFNAEDPFRFAERIAAAHQARKTAEALLRYNLYIDSMPTDEIPQLPIERLQRITDIAFTSALRRTNAGKPGALLTTEDITTIFTEINNDYSRTMNKIIFDLNLRDNAQRALFGFIDLPNESPVPPARWSGVLQIPAYDFAQVMKNFNFCTYYNQPEVIDAITRIKEESNGILQRTIFQTLLQLKKTITIDEFETSQRASIDKLARSLSENTRDNPSSSSLGYLWQDTIKNIIRNSLKFVGKGWLNIFERNRETYELSKLKRFMTTVRLIMQDTLRFLIEKSLEEYTLFIERFCNYKINISSCSTIEVTSTEDESGVEKRFPLFYLELMQDKGSLFMFNTPEERFVTGVLEVFDKAISEFQKIPQVEMYVMDQFFWSEVSTLLAPKPNEPRIQQLRKRTEDAIRRAIVPLREYLEKFQVYIPLLQLNTIEYVKNYEKDEHSLDEMRKEIQRHMRTKTEILNEIPSRANLGTFVVECSSIRSHLSKKSYEIGRLILELIGKVARSRSAFIRDGFLKLSGVLQRKNPTIEQLTKTREFMATIPQQTEELQRSIQEMKTCFDLLEYFHHPLTDEDFKQKWSCLMWPKKIEDLVDVTEKILKEERDKLADEMHFEQDHFSKELDKLSRVVTGFSKHNDINRVAEVAHEVKMLQKQLKECEAKAKLFNSREALFEKETTQYSQLSQLMKEFEPYANLWVTANDWQNWHKSWMKDPFETLDPNQIEKDVTSSYKVMFHSVKIFKDLPSILKIADAIKREIDEFKPKLPIIKALRNPGMRERHWKAISKAVDIEIIPGTTLQTLADVETLKIAEHMEKIQKVCDVAGKEYTIEKSLKKMKSDWEEVEFEIKDYRETKTYVMKGSDDIGQLLDDHIVLTQSLGFSPNKKEFEEEISTWEYQLNLVSEVIEQWLNCQREWMALEPIFASPEIMGQLPVETKSFKSVDAKWRKYLSLAKQNPHVMTFCTTTPKLLESFQECNSMLAKVQKGLNEYLEKKRQGFARLYFLSNGELLEILSQTRDPTAVQPYLRKCFENIAELEFQPDLQITAMYSGEGEKIPFEEPVIPEGSVEIWLTSVERMMKRSIKQQILNSLKDYVVRPRSEWVLRWPGQIALVGTQVFWTKEVAEHLEAEGVEGLRKYHKQLESQLYDITQVVQGNITKLNRITLGALITLDVHARDVVDQMIEADVGKTTDFEWISQLRYYWEDDNCMVKQVDSSFIYGYEYLGNTSRLVITPLTDRIYLTLTGALKLNLGGAPAGPAGTGKTETVKDLAKALAKQCVVFNCQEGLDHNAMGQFFKGMVMSGAWACFDEFNRIDVEVLSVVAQQITVMQKAIVSGAKKLDFEGTTLSVDPTFATFITMNPGYAGRTELPDNLKALFRPVACMVPNYELIAEIRLFSFGFTQAKGLARKMVATFRLSSEQLSSQDHYDFGMRAVNTVISAAGLLRRDQPDMDEELLLLRALRDSNLPKFLSNDVTLFNGIISDLFPGTEPPDFDYGALNEALIEGAKSLGLQPIPNFIGKCIQLYETTVLRHGLMIVGDAGAGKTSCYKTLQRAITTLSKSEHNPNNKYKKIKTYICNPKSIKMGQLYGQYDPNTRDWTDGVLAVLFRKAADPKETVSHKWIILDGPVDAEWIETMNTVLDENKKLCLPNRETIPMTPLMNLIFEVGDLSQASPATVSRCGMIYMEPSFCVGFEPLVDSWLLTLPSSLGSIAEKLKTLCMSILEPCVEFTRGNLKEYIPTVNSNLTQSCFRIMNGFFTPFRQGSDMDDVPREKIDTFTQNLPSLFVFSTVWSAGASCDLAGRKKFDRFIREQISSCDFAFDIPTDGLIYDYFYNVEQNQWQFWLDTVPEFTMNPQSDFADIIVPTADIVRYSWLIEHLSVQGRHVVCVGPTGTGKSIAINEKLLKGMSDTYIPIPITFSAQTDSNQVQNTIDSKLDKRIKGVYGPPVTKKFIIFVDDMNMPQRDKYGTQAPIELLRQWMDHNGWYELKTDLLPFKKIIDISFIGAMGPPGGGRNPMTPRFLRHFNFCSFPELEDASITKIFSTILGTVLRNSYTESIQNTTSTVVQSSIDIYNTICRELLPTPSKSHYTFNLRDLAKVFQGMLSGSPSKITNPRQYAKLWIHECSRVFRDRLVNNDDREWFDQLLKTNLRTHYGLEWDVVVNTPRVIYGDFLYPDSDQRIYQDICDMDQLTKVVEDYLEEYNALTNTPMKLVMFLDAIEHLTRICRIIRQPGGNALLLGIGGSGRRSLTKLATFMCDLNLFQIEITKGFGRAEWKDSLKKVLMAAGLENKKMVFLFADTQIVMDSFLEDINNILNSGDVPSLYEIPELDVIYNAMRPICQAEGLPMTKITFYSRYVKQVVQNMHIVLCMSPMGEVFRSRLRMFPSLVNCCTIDWFAEWPREALYSVARSGLEQMQLKQFDDVLDMCVFIHQSVESQSKRFLQEVRRYNYVTPTSYLELLSTFETLYKEKKERIARDKGRLEQGLSTLRQTEVQVNNLKTELETMKPQLIEKSEELEKMLALLEKDTEEAEKTRIVVKREEEDASQKERECRAMKEDAENDLAEVVPMLDQALASLKNLRVDQIQEVAGYKSPSQGVLMVMEAVCIMMEVPPKRVNQNGEISYDYWAAARALLGDAKGLLERMLAYDRDDIAEKLIKRIARFMNDEEFQPSKVAKISKACTAMCEWVRAMYNYHFAAKAVAPKREALQVAENELRVVQANLDVAKNNLQQVEDKIRQLQEKYTQSMAEKDELQAKVEECTVKLDRAERLMSGLGGEKARWTDTINQFSEIEKNLLGDMLVAAGTVAYLGAFSMNYRLDLLKNWRMHLEQIDMHFTPNTNVNHSLADPVVIRGWTAEELPADQLSIENAIILTKARRWPLMIDPQGQAHKWIKNREKESGLKIVKLSDKNLLRTLEVAVSIGGAVLLENIGEELDPALESILLKQTFLVNGSPMMKIGENTVHYDSNFRFYMTTKLRNPHYSPESCVKVTLLNFFITPEGLEDQLLGLVVAKERPDLEQIKSHLVHTNAKMRKDLKDLEDSILKMIGENTGDILENENLILALYESKRQSTEIAEKVETAEKTEVEIDATRNRYRPVAFRASLLFFCVSDMALVDPMYQYSLQWFINLYTQAIEKADASDDLDVRLTNLNTYFTYSLYSNICRSLFEKHKLLFSFIMCIKIIQGNDALDAQELRFLLAGSTSNEHDIPNPDSSWLTDQMWSEVLEMSKLPHFSSVNFTDVFIKHSSSFRNYFESSQPHKERIPILNDHFDAFQRILILRCLRPDKVTEAVQDFVADNIGKEFIEPPTFDIGESFKDSSCTIPLIFILSPGADPAGELDTFAEDMRFSKKLLSISLGQGQGGRAERKIAEAMELGYWVLLQNCHLATSWMPSLERIVENFSPDKMKREFRLWLTSMPSDKFPVSVLQNSVKMTNEPPKGLRANLMRSYAGFNAEFLEHPKKPVEFKKLLFSTCFFHAIIQERRKFGPLGWNIRYEYTSGDLQVCIQQLSRFLSDYADEVPYKVLKFLTGQINYGGRVTDDWDRRTLMTILDNYICPEALEDNYSFSPSSKYLSPPAGEYKSYTDYIKTIDLNPKPEVFGLHENADITYSRSEIYEMLHLILNMQPRVASGSGQSRDQIIEGLCKDISRRIPDPFDIDDISAKYPTRYSESMNTVIVQEALRYNKLLVVIKQSLKDMQLAIIGKVVMSEQLERMGDSLFNNQVPTMWAERSYPSLKPLASWVSDLRARLMFLQDWINNGPPVVYWISGFFFPQAFLTGTLQNYARKMKYSIDTISFDFEVITTPADKLNEKPTDGCYISGLFLEGARWDLSLGYLVESRPRELFTEMPVIWLRPVKDRKKPSAQIYDCPVYKTLTRAGTLSTTGHSTNYVLTIELASVQPQAHWIKRGVALICALDY